MTLTVINHPRVQCFLKTLACRGPHPTSVQQMPLPGAFGLVQGSGHKELTFYPKTQAGEAPRINW